MSDNICIDCGTLLHKPTALRCKSCNMKHRYKDTKIPIKYCPDCGLHIKRTSMYCHKCFGKHYSISKIKPNKYCPDCEKLISYNTIRCRSCASKHIWTVNRDKICNILHSQRCHDAMSCANKKHWTDLKYREHITDCARKQLVKMWDDPTSKFRTAKHFQPSSLEIKFKQYLDAANIEYIQQYRITGCRKIYDFLLIKYNTLVEIDGMNWHHSDWAIANGVTEADALKDKLAYDNGYTLIRIPECDLTVDIVTSWLIPELAKLAIGRLV